MNVLATLAAADPIGRDEARELARRELDKPVYHQDDPSVVGRLMDKIHDLIDQVGRTISGEGQQSSQWGWFAVAVIALILLAVAAIMWRLGGVRRAAARKEALLDESKTAKDHRADAERHAADGEWAQAIRERLRAVARDLEERAIIEPHPGRTADELAAEAGRAMQDVAAEFTEAVRIFDDVWYGERPGTPDGYATLTRLDEHVRATKPRPLEPEPVS